MKYKLSGLEETLLLVLLEKRLYGKQIKEGASHALGRNVSYGSLYPTLHRLVDKGFLRWEWGEDDGKYEGARRKYYEIRAEGAEALVLSEQMRQRASSWSPPLEGFA
jgi:DNA-binding PadR family transcriptional regulator